MKYISFSDYFDKYSEDFEEEFLLEVEQENYRNTDEDFFEFMSYKFESSIGDYEDQKYDEMRDENLPANVIDHLKLGGFVVVIKSLY